MNAPNHIREFFRNWAFVISILVIAGTFLFLFASFMRWLIETCGSLVVFFVGTLVVAAVITFGDDFDKHHL